MKTKSLFLVVFLVIFITINQAHAQYLRDINGRPMATKIYTNVEGSAFLVDDWSKGTIKMVDGRTYKDILLKYNLVDDEIYFQYKNDETLAFVDPVREFKLSYIINDIPQERLFRNGYKDIPGSTEKSYFEVLSEGTALLLKKDSRAVYEAKDYGSSSITKKFNENIKYYLIVAGKAMPLKRDKKFIFAALGNKQAELDAYIKTNNLNLKDDNDVAKLINHYNSI